MIKELKETGVKGDEFAGFYKSSTAGGHLKDYVTSTESWAEPRAGQIWQKQLPGLARPTSWPDPVIIGDRTRGLEVNPGSDRLSFFRFWRKTSGQSRRRRPLRARRGASADSPVPSDAELNAPRAAVI